MLRPTLAAIVAATIGLGTIAPANAADPRRPWCERRDINCDGRVDWRDRFYDPPRGYHGRPYTYGSEGYCAYPTPRGPIRGYKPQGKDRCCVETRWGPRASSALLALPARWPAARRLGCIRRRVAACLLSAMSRQDCGNRQHAVHQHVSPA